MRTAGAFHAPVATAPTARKSTSERHAALSFPSRARYRHPPTEWLRGTDCEVGCECEASFHISLDSGALASIIGHPGEQTGPVFKITIGRPDINLREHGAVVNARMGLNTWAAFTGSDGDAIVAGDVAMLEREVTPVLKALRSHGLDVVSLHHHMTGVSPTVIFVHYYGKGQASTLARGVRAALDAQGKW